MVNSPYESNYQESYNDIYECVMGVSPPKLNRRVARGGKAIASGGYGCVLRPAIKCQGDRSRKKGYISKLLTIKAAKEEMQEISDALKIIKRIPNYSKYFAVTDYKMCIPGTLTSEDKRRYKYECAMPLGISLQDFDRKRIAEVRAIISPDLGTDVSKSLKILISVRPKELKLFLGKFNIQAADFLEKGLSQLQKHQYYHSDVKPQNLMTDFNESDITESFNYIKLIDFGLALPYNATALDVNTYFLFNSPFTALFFSTSNAQSLNRKIQRSLVDKELTEHARNLLRSELEGYGRYLFSISKEGHIPYILEVGSSAFNMTQSQFTDFIIQLWSEYVLEAVAATLKHMKQTNKETYFSRQPYWDTVYKHNLDIWGFLTCFLILASYANLYGYPEIGSIYLERIVNKYLYNPIYGGRKIPVNEVCAELRDIAIELGFTNKHTPVKEAEKKKTLKDINYLEDNSNIIELPGKRCPNGYIRHKTIRNKCVKKEITVKKLGMSLPSKREKTNKSVIILKSKRKRCPRGYRKHKTLKNKCVKK